MSLDTEKIASWLVSGLELKSALFHTGQYCGTWQASTAGRQQASFHVVLQGNCWLHLPASRVREAESIALSAGDAVFLLKDMPHCLSPLPLPPTPGRESARVGTMRPISIPEASDDSRVADDPARQGIGLACGFFEFRSGLDDSVLALLPDHVISRQGSAAVDGAQAIFELIRAETLRTPESPSPLIARLTELLFIYALRALAQREDIAPGLWRLMNQAEFAPLIAAVIEMPAERWTIDTMADFVHMSRARFCKHFVDACGQPPAQFVTLVRMKLAAAMLRAGATTPDAAEQVGYQSESAFAQAFKRVTGEQPGAYRRTRPVVRPAAGAGSSISFDRTQLAA